MHNIMTVFIFFHFRANLVPVYSFGENDLYTQVKNPSGSQLRQWQNKVKNIVGFAPPIFHGRGIFQYTFGILPHRRAVNTVGKLAYL